MRAVLIALAAAAAIPATASAQTVAAGGFSGSTAFADGSRRIVASSGVSVHRGDYSQGGDHSGDYRDRHRYSREGSGYFVGDLRDGYDINRGWAADSYNDWWHDRPDRAFPRWMTSNQACERQFWTGSGWRC